MSLADQVEVGLVLGVRDKSSRVTRLWHELAQVRQTAQHALVVERVTVRTRSQVLEAVIVQLA